MTETLTNLGVAGATLAILFFIVKFFVSAITKKDDYITAITKNFTRVVENHIQHSTKALEKVSDTNKEMMGVLLELKDEIRTLRELNHNKGRE